MWCLCMCVCSCGVGEGWVANASMSLWRLGSPEHARGLVHVNAMPLLSPASPGSPRQSRSPCCRLLPCMPRHSRRRTGSLCCCCRTCRRRRRRGRRVPAPAVQPQRGVVARRAQPGCSGLQPGQNGRCAHRAPAAALAGTPPPTHLCLQQRRRQASSRPGAPLTWQMPVVALHTLVPVHLQAWPEPARQSPWPVVHTGSCTGGKAGRVRPLEAVRRP